MSSLKEKDGDALNYETLDGWEDLGDDEHAKIKKAIEQGHVDDSDWRGVSAMKPSTP